MKFTGELTVKAPRAQVYKAVRDARFFASCVDGVNDLQETAPDTYSAVFETKVAYMKFSFKVTVEVVRAEEPREIEAKVEGTPLGIVGRLTATSLTTLTEAGDDTKIAYEVEAALTGKLGSLGQPVLRSKAKEMERQFAAQLAAAFATQHGAVTAEPIAIDTDVLVIGSGAAGMYAAIEAARNGAHVLLADRSLIGRGGATVMAQMTVAVRARRRNARRLGSIITPTPSPPAAGCATKRWRSCCARRRRTASASWIIGASAGRARTATSPRPWRRATTGRAASMWISSIPVPRCRRPCAPRWRAIRRSAKPATSASSISSSSDGEVTGAVAYHLGTGAPVVIAAKATVLATGGLTRLYRRNSASTNMGGDGYALALRAGATLIDMEFVQFFPIGHLAPRLVGMDPIMWDPFRYKLGGRLLNGRMEEFTSRYGSDEDGKYVLTRDLATYAIIKEVEAGRGSPHGGAYLSFEHCSGGGAARGIRPGDRSPGRKPHRPHPHAGRSGADRALPHGRREGRREHGDGRAWLVRRRRSGRRRQRRQSSFRQRHHRSAGVRPPRRAQRRRARASAWRSQRSSRKTPPQRLI